MVADIQSMLAWFLVGMLTGATASEFLSGRGFGQRADTGIGIAGALLGGLGMSLLGLQGQGGLVASTAAAFVGAVLLTGLARVARRPAPAARPGGPGA
jgi:uncharacterized membrane protein YeaQ/YmgE (transglycosylase-associated protein family)